MNKVVLYVRENELTHKLLVVHVHAENVSRRAGAPHRAPLTITCAVQEPPPQEFAQHVRILDEIYPKIKIDFVAVKASVPAHAVPLPLMCALATCRALSTLPWWIGYHKSWRCPRTWCAFPLPLPRGAPALTLLRAREDVHRLSG